MSGSNDQHANWFDEDPPKKRAIAETELRTIAQKGVRNSQIAYRSEVIAQGRAIDPHVFGHYCAPAITSDLFGEGDQALAELELEKRQIEGAIAEKSEDAAFMQREVGPWYDLQKIHVRAFKEEVEREGFKVGGEQSVNRLSRVAHLDAVRASLRQEFKELGRLNNHVKSLKNRLRGVEVEIKIVKGKSKRKAK
jgi:hypothetical protein